jgi:hypothetical protein
MSETPAGPMVTVVSDGYSVTTNRGTAEEIEANLKSDAKPKDGESEDPKKAEERETKAAAAKLGKKGGEAAAKARAKADKEPDLFDDEPEAKPKEVKAESEQKVEEPAKDEDKPGNPRHDAKARIAQLAREKNEERSKREALEARLAKLEAERKPAEKEPEKATAPKKPTPDDFGTYEDYVEALADHKADERIRKMRQEDEQRQQLDKAVEHVKKRGETFRERVFAAEKADPALKARLAAPEAVELQKELAPSWSVPPGTPMKAINAISDAIIDSEQAPQLLVYLAENPDDMDRIRSLPDHAAVMRAIGRLEGTVSSQEATPEPAPSPKAVQPVSQAKPPVRPISGAPAVAEDDPDAEDDFDAYKRKADARDSRLRRVR